MRTAFTSIALLLAMSSVVRADGFSSLAARVQAAPSGTEDMRPGIFVQAKRGHVSIGVCFAPLGETLASETADGVVPTFRRLHETMASSWTVDIAAALQRTSWRGNAVFYFYDLDDKGSLTEDRYAAMYQVDIDRSRDLYAHAHLSPAGGFVPGHTYRMQIAQLIHGDRIVLAESDLRLE